MRHSMILNPIAVKTINKNVIHSKENSKQPV